LKITKIHVHICYNVICCILSVLTLNDILSLFNTMSLVRSNYVSSEVKICMYICFVVNIRNEYAMFPYVQVNRHNILTRTEDSMSFIVNIFNIQTSSIHLLCLFYDIDLDLDRLSYKYAVDNGYLMTWFIRRSRIHLFTFLHWYKWLYYLHPIWLWFTLSMPTTLTVE
jgi:hypothetical protein